MRQDYGTGAPQFDGDQPRVTTRVFPPLPQAASAPRATVAQLAHGTRQRARRMQRSQSSPTALLPTSASRSTVMRRPVHGSPWSLSSVAHDSSCAMPAGERQLRSPSRSAGARGELAESAWIAVFHVSAIHAAVEPHLRGDRTALRRTAGQPSAAALGKVHDETGDEHHILMVREPRACRSAPFQLRISRSRKSSKAARAPAGIRSFTISAAPSTLQPVPVLAQLLALNRNASIRFARQKSRFCSDSFSHRPRPPVDTASSARYVTASHSSSFSFRTFGSFRSLRDRLEEGRHDSMVEVQIDHRACDEYIVVR